VALGLVKLKERWLSAGEALANTNERERTPANTGEAPTNTNEDERSASEYQRSKMKRERVKMRLKPDGMS